MRDNVQEDSIQLQFDFRLRPQDRLIQERLRRLEVGSRKMRIELRAARWALAEAKRAQQRQHGSPQRCSAGQSQPRRESPTTHRSSLAHSRPSRALVVVSVLGTVFGSLGGTSTGAAQDDRPQAATTASTATPQRSAYFGDLHVHTRYSYDAYPEEPNTPDEAYAYAKGETLVHRSGVEIRLSRPLDFLAVTDHAEALGLRATGNRSACKDKRSEACREAMAVAWRLTIDAAERHNEPGVFTALIGHEYGAMAPDGGQRNRNVIYRSAEVPNVPFSRWDSNKPENLWLWLRSHRVGDRDAIAIPHNTNLSRGYGFSPPADASAALLQATNEPVLEVNQNKGASETHPLLSPDDEQAGFQIHAKHASVRPAVLQRNYWRLQRSYWRSALNTGLELEAAFGVNPYRFGVVGASDSHAAAGSYDERTYMRGSTVRAEQRDAVFRQAENGWVHRRPPLNRAWQGTGGLTGVWADENTRAALFDGIRRRETFATSGPRIRVRVFAGIGMARRLAETSDEVATAYEHGVPMGGVLTDTAGGPLSLLVSAFRDPQGTPLQRVQVVKGWLQDGEARERVVDIACSDGLAPDPATGGCPDNGAAVDLSDCSVSTHKGSNEITTVWTDPDFNSGQAAYYYVRVLENPSCRWSTWDAVSLGVQPHPDLPATHQERAWTSPIWVEATVDEARLSSLTLSGVDIGSFSPDVESYTGNSAASLVETTVTAIARDGNATVSIAPIDSDPESLGHQVALAQGETTITVTVTALDGVTTKTYTTVVTVPPADGGVAPEDEDEDEDEGVAATWAVTSSRRHLEEGQSATITVGITNGVTFDADESIALSVSGTASSDDYTLSATEAALAAGAATATATLTVVDDAVEEGLETIVVAARHGDADIGTATVMVHLSDPLTEPERLSNPIVRQRTDSYIDLAVEDFVRAPETTDPATADTSLASSAHARIQYLQPLPGGSRLAFNDLRGVLYVTDESRSVPIVYLDLRDEGVGLYTDLRPNETGFLGFAFHPEFAQSGQPGYGKFYTSFSATEEGGIADYLDNVGTHESVVREWTATDPTANVFAGTSREVLRIGQPLTVQNIGSLAFNPAAAAGSADHGNLYIGMGDGGGLNDRWLSGQDLSTPHSAVLRIDPLGGGSGAAYGIPDDNPFAGMPGIAPEIWAYGLRHPQHFSFDGDGRMYINDIGEDQIEEVNIGRAGANYGWRLREGTFATAFGVDSSLSGSVFDLPGSDGGFEYPVIQYDHNGGHRAIGSGFAYEGTAIPALEGKYVFADLVTGRLFAVDIAGLTPGAPSEFQEIRLRFDGRRRTMLSVAGVDDPYRPDVSGAKRTDLRLGIDGAGELYLLTKGDGWIRRLTASSVSSDSPPQDPLTGSFEAMPSTHDGSEAGTFRFEVRFSAPIKGSFRDVRDHGFEVTGGTVSNAKRINRSRSHWEIKVRPSGDEDAVIVLPANRDCSLAGAICTGDGRRLTTRLEATVLGPASLPGRVTGVSVSPRVGSLSVTWEVVSDADGYKVQWRADGEQYDASREQLVTGSTQYVIENLVAGVLQWVRVLATQAGLPDGPPSPEASGTARAEDADAADGDLRLVGGSVESEGRLEVFHDDVWGTVCDDFWDLDNAEVACRQLGYSGASEAASRARFGRGDDPIWLDNVYCRGTESRLADCPHNGWGVHNCGHHEDSGVVCSTGVDGSSAPPAGEAPDLPLEAAVSSSYDGPGHTASSLIAEALQGRSASSLRELDLSGRKLRDLWGVERLRGLEVLRLGGNLLSDLSPLSGLVSLHELDLSDNAVSDLGPLAGLRSLRRLDVSENLVVDLSPLASLSALEELVADGNAVSDLSPLAPLRTLRRLSLARTAAVDLSALAGLRSLERLDLSGNLVADLRPLSGLDRLESLRLAGNRIADVSPLWSLGSLEHLDLSDNRIARLEGLSGASGVTALRLRGNAVSDLGPLAGLARLRTLSLRGNAVRSASALAGLESLERLDLRDNALEDAGPLASLPSLVWVDVSGNRLRELSALESSELLVVVGAGEQTAGAAERANER